MTQEIVEAALSKSGLLIFKELQRFFPTAEPEDYILNGAWNDELLKLDLQLIEAHRREAGADDPLEPEAVPDVSIPPTRVKTASGMLLPTAGRSVLPTGVLSGQPGAAVPAGIKSLLPTGVLKPQGSAPAIGSIAIPKPAVSYSSGALSQVRTIGLLSNKPVPPKQPAPAAKAPAAKAPAATAASPAAPPGSAGDSMLRQFTLFNTKWQINHLATKRVLERLASPARRRYVMLTFTSTTTGEAALLELEHYITKCEKENKWGDDEAGSASAPSSSLPAAQASIAKPKAPSVASAQAAIAKAKAAGLLAPKAPKAGLPRPLGTPAKAGAVAPAGLLAAKRPLASMATPSSDPAAKRPRIPGTAGAAPQAPTRAVGTVPAGVIGARAPVPKLRPVAPSAVAGGTPLRPAKLAGGFPPVIRGPVRPGGAVPSVRPLMRLAAGAKAASARLAVPKPRPY
mmetsp:Transcript_56609/g.104785  ORF Transcript_56609/g.104785 Transcript_56609/m.104785 type:complete len:455 (-) Transcript_56609:167-1531(-)